MSQKKNSLKSKWVCRECGAMQTKWSGVCFSCKKWDSLDEETMEEIDTKSISSALQDTKPHLIHEVVHSQTPRITSTLEEFDHLLGGGAVSGGLTLLGGAPGIGKSTLMLILANAYAKSGQKVLYVCGEESVQQTHLRAKRVGIEEASIYLYNEVNFTKIKLQVETLKPDILILDSIQIAYKPEIPSLPGSLTQVREIAMECLHIAKGMNITTFLIGHVTKSGELAGPRVLEHIVDTVLEFEGDKQHGYRILRTRKHRFGPTDEVAVFEMVQSGLVPVKNPSEIFLKERSSEVSGSCVGGAMEGSRALLVEVQALVADSAFSTSTRRSIGLDQNRVTLLLAVLEKRVGYHFHSLDVFTSVTGGMKISDPALDLTLCCAIASSFANTVIPSDCIIFGEVGLSGEVRSVPRIDARIKEACHLGFKRCILPRKNCEGMEKKGLELYPVDSVESALQIALALK